MSEEQKPVEEPVAPVVTEPVVEDKAVEETPVAPETTETDAAPAAEPAAEPTAEETPVAAVEAAATPFVGEGTLGYKAPGGNIIKKLAGFQKRHFWLGSEAIEPKSLSNYLRGEKPEVGNHNAAWSSQTGKGLLYYSKTASEKSTPHGIINLVDISEITEESPAEFFFFTQGHKHVFQAPTAAERASWIAALKAAAAEAKESVEAITSSDGYKESHASLSKPAVGAGAAVAAAAATATKAVETKKEEIKEETKDRKSRSASRKRNSIFGGFGLGSKKDEPAEDKAVEPTEDATPPVPAVPAVPAVEEPVVPVEAPIVAAAVAEPVVAESTPEAPVEPIKPVPVKRNSIFGSLSSKFGTKKSTSEASPAVPAKDEGVATEPVASEAPVIPAPEASEPLATTVAATTTEPLTNGTPATETPEIEPEATPEAAKTEAKPEIKSERRKSSLPSFSFSKLRQTVKSKIPSKPAEKATEDKAVEPKAEESKAEESKAAEAAPETPAAEPTTIPVDDPVETPVKPANPVVTATA